MKNKIEDLRDHLFAQLERLSDEDATPEKLKMELQRAEAMAKVSAVIVESAKAETNMIAVINQIGLKGGTSLFKNAPVTLEISEGKNKSSERLANRA